MIEHFVALPTRPDEHVAGLFHLEEPPVLNGISARYLENAEQEFARFPNLNVVFDAIKGSIDRRGIDLGGASVIDIASGFGPTVLPLLEAFPSARVVASDLSRQMLTILLRNASERRVLDRVSALVTDAQAPVWRPQCTDLVVGGAALHHMLDPARTLGAVLSALKPGGSAFFLEPMESGHAVLGLAYEEILRLPALSGGSYAPTASFLLGIVKDIDARTHHRTVEAGAEGWRALDDKWLLPLSWLRDVAAELGCTVSAENVWPAKGMFRAKSERILQNFGGLICPECLPPEGWAVLDRFDAAFSERSAADVAIDAVLCFQRR